MISVNRERCDGCGICEDACPTGAIVLRDGLAFVDQELCEQCQVCVDVCPTGAIYVTELMDVEEEPALEMEPASPPPVEMIAEDDQPASPTWGAAIGTALVQALPRLVNLAVDWLERRSASAQQASIVNNQASLQQRQNTPQTITRVGRRNGRGRKVGRRRRQRGRNRKKR